MSENFDTETARRTARRVGGSYHDAWTDEAGRVCLLCQSTMEGGGVSVGKAGLDWLRAQTGDKFVRLLNPASGMDVTVPLDRMPRREWRSGKNGQAFAIFDPEDFDLATAASFPAPLANAA